MYALTRFEQAHPLRLGLGVELERAIEMCDKIFGAIKREAFYERPIALRHPIVFYYGHLPAFAWNQILRGSLQHEPFNPEFDQFFERGIDPESASDKTSNNWPSIAQVERYKWRVEDELFRLTDRDAEDDPAVLQALHIAIEHYWMHAETLLYMVHQLPHNLKRPFGYHRITSRSVDDYGAIMHIPEGLASLGANPIHNQFVWCNERGQHQIYVPSFAIDKYNVTNADFLEFIESGGYQRQQLWDDESWEWVKSTGREHPQFWFKRDGCWLWKDLFDDLVLPLHWPVYVSHAEACAYARFKGAQLPSEEEWHRAMIGASGGNCDFESLSPSSIGAFPAAQSQFNVHDLIGNGWEWTRTIFAPFADFKPLPSYSGYSADFFDGKHYVLKGASPVTAAKLIRPSFRNWFRPRYPYVYATFRCIYR